MQTLPRLKYPDCATDSRNDLQLHTSYFILNKQKTNCEAQQKEF